MFLRSGIYLQSDQALHMHHVCRTCMIYAPDESREHTAAMMCTHTLRAIRNKVLEHKRATITKRARMKGVPKICCRCGKGVGAWQEASQPFKVKFQFVSSK